MRDDGVGADARFDLIPWAALDANGDILLPRFENDYSMLLRRVTPSGVVTTSTVPVSGAAEATEVSYPAGYTYDPARGAHYLVPRTQVNYFDPNLPVFLPGVDIWRITSDGALTEFAGKRNTLGSNDGTGTDARFAAQIIGPVIDTQGNLYVGDGNRLRKITPAGVVSTLVTAIVPPVAGESPSVRALAVDSAGTVYVLSSDAVLRKVTPQGQVTVLAGAHNEPGYVDGVGSAARFPADAEDMPRYLMAVDSDGNLYIPSIAAEPIPGVSTTGSIRKVTPDGTVTTIAGQLHKNGIVLGPLPGRMAVPLWVLSTPSGLVTGSGQALLKIEQ